MRSRGMGDKVTFKRLSIAFSVRVFLLYAGLILSLFYFYTGPLFLETLRSARTLFSLKLSLLTATASTAISVFFAVPSAYALSRYRFFGRQIIDTILELPMIVSPIALGALVLIFFNTPGRQLHPGKRHPGRLHRVRNTPRPVHYHRGRRDAPHQGCHG